MSGSAGLTRIGTLDSPLTDPQTITCAFWKAGRCDKGSKCKFAHSQDASRKVQKKDLYTDTREGEDKQNGECRAERVGCWSKQSKGAVAMSV